MPNVPSHYSISHDNAPNGLEDLLKCRDYLERCIAIYESDLMLIRR